MVCEVGCSKQLKIIAVEGKKTMYEGILAQLFTQYITEEGRREELLKNRPRDGEGQKTEKKNQDAED